MLDLVSVTRSTYSWQGNKVCNGHNYFYQEGLVLRYLPISSYRIVGRYCYRK